MIFICFLSAFFACACSAAEEEALLSELREVLPPALRAEDTESLLSRVGVRGLMEEILASLSGEGSALMAFLLLCLGSTVLVSAAHATAEASLSSLLEAMAAAMMGLVIFGPLKECALAAVEMLSETVAFFGAAAPILHGITLAAGGVQSASAGAMGAEITLYIVNLFFSELVLPIVSVIFALGLICTLGEEGAALSSLAGSVKRIFLWLLGLGTTLLGAALSLQTVLAAGVDNTAMRTAKYAAAGLLPLVGGAVSASLSTLATGLSFVKTTAGVSVVAALLLLCVPLLVRLLLYRLCLDIASGFSEFLGIRGTARMFATFRSAMDALIAVTALSSVLFLLQSILFLHVGVAIL
ncbi:MAG: hypothetical protein J6K14_10260 [Clostridia bacterium]|nr:hypothetical protein [Clostridia bacterium]